MLIERALDDALLRARVDADVSENSAKSSSSMGQKLALACRYLAREGHAQNLAGQVSVKNDDGSLWATDLSTGFACATASTMVRLDEDLRVLEGDGKPNPATRFHLWVYAKRPDVKAIVHTHPVYASALAMSGQPLVVSHMDMMMFYEDVAQLTEWPGVPIANEEGRIIAQALGEKNSILLANHGILSAGVSLEYAVYRAASLEHAAKLQYLTYSAGHAPLPVRAELAADAKKFLNSPKIVELSFNYWCAQMRKSCAEALD
jgi:L-fuculose-phosphate aldolase